MKINIILSRDTLRGLLLLEYVMRDNHVKVTIARGKQDDNSLIIVDYSSWMIDTAKENPEAYYPKWFSAGLKLNQWHNLCAQDYYKSSRRCYIFVTFLQEYANRLL